jgi:hypothetical protein
MPNPRYFFRLPPQVADTLEALAEQMGTAPGEVVKLIVTREIMNIPALLDEHDRQLEDMHQFLRQLTFHHADFLAGHEERRDAAAKAVLAKLNDIMVVLDAIRDAAFVRSTPSVARRHHE